MTKYDKVGRFCNTWSEFILDAVDSNHIDHVPDARLYDDHDLASPDNDQLQLPVPSDAAPRHAGLCLLTAQQTVLVHFLADLNAIMIICQLSVWVLLFWHAPLGVRSAVCRHQPPQRMVLGQVDCFVQCEVVGSQSALNGVQPRDMRTPWWSLPVVLWGSC